MLLLSGYQVNAQTIPTNPAVKVSYDSEVTTYKQVSSSTDLNQLTDIEKLSFKKRVNRRRVDDYLTARNETVRVITNGTREGYEGIGADPVVKVIIDKNGASSFSASNQVIDYQAVSSEGMASEVELSKLITKDNFLQSPTFTAPTAAQIKDAQASGFSIVVNETGFSIKGQDSEFVYNSSQKLAERKILSAGKVVAVFQDIFMLNSANKLIPAMKIQRNYETSTNGVLIECVKIETITNYSRIQN